MIGIGIGIPFGGINVVGGTLAAAETYFPLTHSLYPSRIGYGAPSYANATVGTFVDCDGMIRVAPANCAAFTGARMVRNLIVGSSEDFSNANWTKSRSTYIDGKLLDSVESGTHRMYQAATLVNGATYAGFCEVKAAEYTKVEMEITDNNEVNPHIVVFDLVAKTATTTFGSPVSTITELEDGWFRCFIKATPTLIPYGFFIGLINAAAERIFIGDGTKGVFIRKAQLEDVSGQADQTASEYVSVGADKLNYLINTETLSTQNVTTVAGQYTIQHIGTGTITLSGTATGSLVGAGNLTFTATAGTLTCTVTGTVTKAGLNKGATPLTYFPVGSSYLFHGAGADGVKFFNTYKDGTNIPQHLLKGPQGQGARTNSILWSRDYSNAVWAKTNVGVSTCAGTDGSTINGRLTAQADNAKITQVLTHASAIRSLGWWIKRVTGTGAISISLNDGASYTDITSLINSSTYAWVRIENQILANSSATILIATSGDVIDVDRSQNEAGTTASMPIDTTTTAVARNADALSILKSGNMTNAQGWVLATWSVLHGLSTQPISGYTVATDANGRILYAPGGLASTNDSIYDGTTQVISVGLSHNNSVMCKQCTTWKGTTSSETEGLKTIAEGAASVATANYDGTMGAASTISICGITNNELYGNLKELYIGNGTKAPPLPAVMQLLVK